MLCCQEVYINMKQSSPNQVSEKYKWNVQLWEHLLHLLPPGTNCSLSSVCITSPPESHKAIRTSLKQQNCTVDKIQGDGNCMFWSFLKELFGSEEYHLDLVTDFQYYNLQLQPASYSKKTCMHHINNDPVWGTTTELLLATNTHLCIHKIWILQNILGISSNHSAYRNCTVTILL